ncbi:MAG: TIGR03545 family protein, partial [Calditrichia bacterium]|nr:TIGR03545 family protein [Calditrichia bacterium]
MIRKKGIITLVVICALFIAVLFIFTDLWLEGKLEDYGSRAVGAKVDIDGLDVDILSLKFSLNRLQVTDPEHTKRNMFETGKLTFQLNMPALFEKKIIIEKVQVDSFKTFTRRDYDGKIEKKKAKIIPGVVDRQIIKAREKVETELPVGQFTSNVNNMKLDDVLKTVEIKTPGKIDSLQKLYEERLDYWEKELAQVEAKKDIENLKNQLKKINPKKIKKLKQLKNYLKKVDSFKKDVDSLKKVYEKTNKGLTADLKDMQKGPKKIKKWAEEDYSRVGDKLNIPDLDKKKVAEILLGRKIMDIYSQFSYYHGKYNNFMEKQKKDKPEKVKPPRLKGQTIHFVHQKALPSFWIKSIQLSGKTSQDFIIEGNIQDVCFQQHIINKPTTVNLKGTRRDGAVISCSAVLNHVQENFKDKLNFNLNAIPIVNYKL